MVPWLSLATWLAGGATYPWYDAAGQVHVAETLAELPEPFRSIQRSRVATVRPARSANPSSMGPLQAARESQRTQWRTEVRRHREALLRAEARLTHIDQQIEGLRQNPVLAHTVGVKAEVSALLERRGQVLHEFRSAHRVLSQDLPERARREGVSPLWILEFLGES